MQARVRSDDGEHPEWIDVTHGLRQGRVLSPLLFNVFAAVIHLVLLQYASVRTQILLRGSVHLDNDGLGENAEPLDRVRNAV